MDEAAHVLKFAEARASEIASLMEDVNFKKHKTAFQKMPPHMRRRAASHNPKRVPRKLRESYMIQNPHCNSKPKKPHRKIRKRMQKKRHEKEKKNYHEEYASRSRPGGTWLGTHIWHAKRCRMESLWGYKLPIHCNDKKLGAAHQAATKHSMLLDLSYFCCIALSGPEDKLLTSLSLLTDPNSGCTFQSQMYQDGSKEGHAFLYNPSKFPYEAIGPVTFIWKPLSHEIKHVENIARSLWIWCHPSFYDEVVSVLIEIFNLKDSNDNIRDPISDEKDKVENDICKDEDEVEFTSEINFSKVKQYFQRNIKYVNDNICMFLLKDKLVRHRLIGPNAQSILTKVLASAIIEETESVNKDCVATTDDLFNSQASHSTERETNNKISKKHKLDPDIIDSNRLPKKIKLETLNETSKKISDDCSTNLALKSSKLIVNGIDRNQCHVTDIVSREDIEIELPTKKLKLETSSKEQEITSTIKCHHKFWWQNYYKDETAKTSHRKREKLLKYLRNGRSNYYIPPSTVIGLTVRDPRLILNRDKQKFQTIEDSASMSKDLEELFNCDMADSPLWNDNIRDEVTATQISENEINTERSKYAISESITMGTKESKVPILLIHQPGKNGFGCGWDLIAPLGWSMAFWIPLVLNGGRVSGLRDFHFVNLEAGQPSFPLSYPDTQAGSTYEETQRIDELTTYYKRPKAKRANFTSFGTPNPFYMPWDNLIGDWFKELDGKITNILFSNSDISYNKTDRKSNFFVLRQREVQQLQYLCEQISKLKGNKMLQLQNCKQLFDKFVQSSLTSEKQLTNALVLIRLKCLGRGCPTMHSGVYMLDEKDLQCAKNNPNFLGPVEANHSQPKSGDKLEKCASETGSQSNSNKIDPKDLERPQIHSLQSYTSRKMIGYLSEGGFSSIMGKGCGIGHCSLIGLLFALKKCIEFNAGPLVLTREQHSFQYRVSSIEIIPNYL